MYIRYVKISHVAFCLESTPERIKRYVTKHKLYCSKGKVRIEDLTKILDWHFEKKKEKKPKVYVNSSDVLTIFALVEKEVRSGYDFRGNFSDTSRDASFLRFVIWYLLRNNTDIKVGQIAKHYDCSESNIYLGVKNVKDVIDTYPVERDNDTQIEKKCFDCS